MSNITTINPATEEPLETYGLMSKRQAFDAIEECHAAFLKWRHKTHEERAPYSVVQES